MSVADLASASGVTFGTSGVRGLVRHLTPELCHAYTQAFLRLAAPAPGCALVGHDLRPSSPAIAAACRQSARQAGWEAVDAGVIPTPALAFAT